MAEALRAMLVQKAASIAVGDPSQRQHWMGPVINESAYLRYRRCVAHLRQHGRIDAGGETLEAGALANGWFVAPTVAGAPFDDRLWRDEQFLPLVLVGEVDSVAQAVEMANTSEYGLTAGFYGAREEIPAFLDRIEAGVTYVNRPQGATTGAWPGYQPFGGWKASGTTGKAIGSFYYLPQYRSSLAEHVGGRAGGDEHSLVVLQPHLHRTDPSAEPQHLGAGGEVAADPLAKVIDAQVDRAEAGEAVHHLLGRLLRVLLAERHHDRQPGHGVEGGGDHSAVQAAVLVVADQLGPHLEAKPRRLAGRRADELQAEDLVEGDQPLEQLGQRGVQPALLGGTAAG